MTTLAFDPGTRYIAWCVLHDGALRDCGCIIGPELKRRDCPRGVQWKTALANIVEQCRLKVHEFAPDLIACEHTQQNLNPKLSAKSAASNYTNTVRTEELVGHLRALAAVAGVPFAQVGVQASLAPLGLHKGAKDRDVAEAFTRLTGRPLLVRDHHIARAYGVAVRGEREARLQAATAGQGRFAV